ncbi:MAG: hypothetical protein DRO15_02950 [Thermoprotei archaeon]|nr:MAG: hypothetical protein DRO15_02950 [Thermoprotei archaeon]
MRIAAVYALTEETKFEAVVKGPLDKVLNLMKNLGYDGIEINIPNPFNININQLSSKLNEYGLELSAISTGLSYLSYGISLTHSSKDMREKAIEFFIKYSEISSILSRYNYVVIGLARGKCEGRPRSEVLKNLKDSLEEILEKTENYGTIFLIEPINRYETDIINTIEDSIQLAKEYRRVRILLDTYHMTIEDVSPYDAILKAEQYIGYVHAAENNRLAPGMGMLNWELIICRLLRIGYQGYISIEAIPKPSYEEMLRIGIKTLNQYLKLRKGS